MSTHKPLLPSRAVERVNAAGLTDAHSLLADWAAAGLIKTYALVRETVLVGKQTEIVRDAAIPADVWRRIIQEDRADDALSGRTVRLGAGHAGRAPDVEITGVSFSEPSLIKVLERYCSTSHPEQCDDTKPGSAPRKKPKPTEEPLPVVKGVAPATRTSDLVQKLQVARRELALEAALARLDKYHLLILDDLAYITKDQAETSVLFELISARYERRSTLITANQPFGEWGKIFPDPAMTLAAVNRLVHHATIFEMNVESYRRRTATQRQSGAGRPPTYATRKSVAKNSSDNQTGQQDQT